MIKGLAQAGPILLIAPLLSTISAQTVPSLTQKSKSAVPNLGTQLPIRISQQPENRVFPVNDGQSADFWKQWGEILNHGPRLEKAEMKIDAIETRVDEVNSWVAFTKGAWWVLVGVFATALFIISQWGTWFWKMFIQHIWSHGSIPPTPAPK